MSVGKGLMTLCLVPVSTSWSRRFNESSAILDQLEIRMCRKVLQVGGLASPEVVQHDNFVSVIEQALDQMSAQESAALQRVISVRPWSW
jgi:hypothetical protein